MSLETMYFWFETGTKGKMDDDTWTWDKKSIHERVVEICTVEKWLEVLTTRCHSCTCQAPSIPPSWTVLMALFVVFGLHLLFCAPRLGSAVFLERDWGLRRRGE